jgi:hypothetical protein
LFNEQLSKKRLFNKLAPHQTSRLILVAREVDAHLTLANGKKHQEVVGILSLQQD